MEKEYHLYLYASPIRRSWCKDFCLTYDDFKKAIERGDEVINTFQIITCTTELFTLGYRIFVHDMVDVFEITLGKCERTNREIRMGHCLYKMLLAGEFDTYGGIRDES